jgi:ribosomal protein S14
MLFSKVKDFQNRKKLYRTEYKIKAQKYVFINLISKINEKIKLTDYKATQLLKILYSIRKIKPFKVRLLKRCLLNNRSKSVYKTFNLSRSIFREMLQFGLIPGYKKAVW